MKLISTVILLLLLSGCSSVQLVSFSPSQDYSVSVGSSLFDTVRIDANDISLFSKGKAIGFIRIEPVPKGSESAEAFLNELKLSSESASTNTTPLNLPSGFTGYAAKNRNYVTGYLFSETHSDSILIFSFPEGDFDEIVKTVSAGI
ncbi:MULTISPECIES: hypothetical protein [Marinobacter]|uniref:Lipoprotein n=1 Tax=Marinobacter xiaoshiensis TaxID=3073652 RepID=A0ABU2HDZ7_9GAMM|nr:hypothetical protein [Marinobacter sp. F60267]MDS1308831.1 hypothetical protein [Marinobacter sp. F60267]